MHTVIGPTPFGTGEMAATLSFTSSKSTSPHSLPFSIRLIPTSITTAPSLTQEDVTIFGRPIATTRISACEQIDSISGVLE